MDTRELFIFDMDGTMFDTEPISYICWKHICKQYGYELPYEVFCRFLGMNVESIRRVCVEALGTDFPYDAIEKEKKAYQIEYYKTHEVPVKPGLMECLEYAKQHHIPCAVASSTALPIIGYLLEKNKVKPYFSIVKSGAMIPNGKPAPDIFLMVCKEAGVAPQNALVFEDSANGVLAGHNADIPVIWIPDLMRIPDDIAAYAWKECASLHEVPALLGERV